MRIPAFKNSSDAASRSPSIYEWARNIHGLMPLRASCSTACWMSGAASIEWKSYSRSHYNYVAWLPESTPHAIFRLPMLGTRSLLNSAAMVSGMSTQVRKNVQRLRTSKFLTCDVLSAQLEKSSPCAMKPSRRFVYGIEVAKGFGKTSLQSFVSANSSRLWSDEGSDPIDDVRRWQQLMLEEYYR